MIIAICPFCSYAIALEREEDFRDYIRCDVCSKIVSFARLISTSGSLKKDKKMREDN
jgi:hypothetical protein